MRVGCGADWRRRWGMGTWLDLEGTSWREWGDFPYFKSQISNCRFQISSLKFQIADFKSQVSNLKSSAFNLQMRRGLGDLRTHYGRGQRVWEFGRGAWRQTDWGQTWRARGL